MGIPQQTDGIDQYDNIEAFSGAPADEAWVFSCVSRIFNAAQSVPLRVYVRQGKDLIPNEDAPSPEGTALQYLLDNVNPVDMTGSELKGYTAASRKVWGGWYWQKVRGQLGGPPQELYWHRVPDITPYSRDGRTIDYYTFRPKNGSLQIIQPRDMIRKRGLNMKNQIDMVSPLSAARYDMVTQQAGSQHTASTLRRRGVPEGYWQANKGTEITRTDRSAITRWLRTLVGPRNAGKSLVAPDITYVPLALPEKDAQWLMARSVSRLTVCAVLGVPLALAGDPTNSGFYRSVLDAERVFWKDTMVVELDGDADAINNWLVPDFITPGGPQLAVAYDYSKVAALKLPLDVEWNDWLNGIDRQVIVPNEFRAHFGVGINVPWGDSPVPKTTIGLKDPTFQIPAQMTKDQAEEPEPVELLQPDLTVGDEEDISASLRSIGRRLYQQTAVRAFVAHGGPLDTYGLIGANVSRETRQQIEDGLRRRWSAERIAEELVTA